MQHTFLQHKEQIQNTKQKRSSITISQERSSKERPQKKCLA